MRQVEMHEAQNRLTPSRLISTQKYRLITKTIRTMTMKNRHYQLRFFQIMIAWAFLCGLVAAQQRSTPDITSSPVSWSNTYAWISLNASVTKAGFAPKSQFLRSLASGSTAYVCFDVPYSKRQPLRRAVFKRNAGLPNSDGVQMQGLTVWVDDPSQLIAGDSPTTSQVKNIQAAKASVDKYPIRIIMVPPEYVLETFEQGLPTLPESMGAVQTKIVTRGLRWFALGMDPKTQKLEANIQSTSPVGSSSVRSRLAQNASWHQICTNRFTCDRAPKLVERKWQANHLRGPNPFLI